MNTTLHKLTFHAMVRSWNHFELLIYTLYSYLQVVVLKEIEYGIYHGQTLYLERLLYKIALVPPQV